MLAIDRNQPFRLAEIESLAPFEALYTTAGDDEACLRLTSIDADEIQLIPLDPASDRGATRGSNQRAADKLARLKGDGSVFLDGRVLATLLRSAGGVPAHWRGVVTAKGDPAGAATIRFYGSRFRSIETGAVHVLGLAWDGGRWAVELEPVEDDGRVACAAIVGTITESSWAAGD